MPSNAPQKLVICLVALVLHAGARSETFLPLPVTGSMGLGSGVNILRPTEAIPSCFDFTQRKVDVDDGALTYQVSVKAVSNVEEVKRIRRKGASMSGSYGKVSASLEAWQNTDSSDKKSNLYVVIEARSIGPRIEAGDMKPKAIRQTLLDQGTPAEILKQCGSHVVTTVNRGQTLRIVLDLREADTASKQEIGGKFGAQAKFVVFKAKASASYSSSVEKLARERKIDVLVEGSGTPPDTQAVIDILKAKAGDLEAVAEALKPLLAAAGKKDGYVGYGLTLQPLRYFSAKAATGVDTPDALRAMERIAEYAEILKAQVDSVDLERNVGGLSDATRTELDGKRKELRALAAELRTQWGTCLLLDENAVQSCEDIAIEWGMKLRDIRRVKVSIQSSKEGALLVTSLPYKAQGQLVATFAGEEIALDSLPFARGEQKQIIAVQRVLPNIFQRPPISTAGTPSPYLSGQPPTITAMGTVTPLLLSAISVASVSKLATATAGGPQDWQTAYIGCYGALLSSALDQMDLRIVVDQHMLPADSPCKLGFGIAPFMGGGVAYPIAGVPMTAHLMPPGVSAIKVAYPTAPVQLKLLLTDVYGFEASYLLLEDLRSEMPEHLKR